MTEPAPEPYRLLFPLGVAFALAGAAPWWLNAVVPIAWPGPLHMSLMIQGFEQSFILGFLLTAMPGLTGGPRCGRWELAAAMVSLIAFAVFAVSGPAWAAQLAFVLSLAVPAFALSSRITHSRKLPPEEFAFVVVGLGFGVAGAAMIAVSGTFGWTPPAFRLGERLLSLGMVLSIVLGVGGLLVPAFAGVRDPLAIPGFAGPHERPGRRRLYVPVALTLIAAFGLEAAGHARAGAVTRALGASALLMLVWKLWRRPRFAGALPYVLWASGWSTFTGLWLAASWPAQAIAAYHVVFLGGFGLLTLGIGTRVVVSHGRQPLTNEGRLLAVPVLSAVGLALVLRAFAALAPRIMVAALAASAALWSIAWVLWAVQAVPGIVAPRRG